MVNSPDMLVIHQDDNVATALRDLQPGVSAWIAGVQGERIQLLLVEAIRLGHKAALESIAEGATVIKHGQPIGRATAPIKRGGHVHTHNVESLSVHDDEAGA